MTLLREFGDRLLCYLQRLVGLVVVLALFGLIAVALFGTPRGQAATCPAQPLCEPYTTLDRNLCGPELRGRTATGEWRGWWYRVAVTPTSWEWCRFSWASLDKVAPTTLAGTMAIVDRIKAASSPLLGIMDAITTYGVQPAPGQDAYDFALLHHAACQALVAAGPPNGTGWSAPPVCTEPTRPVTHRVKANGTALDRPAYTLINGVRGTTAVGRALVGQPCDLNKPTLASGADVWAQFGPDFVAGRVALCAKAAP
jgi:hypothetical protein